MAQIDEKVLWGAAEKLRDKCDPADYKNVVLGLVFLKYVSDKFVIKYKELKKFGDGREDDEDYYIQDHVFIVPHEALWSEVAKHSKQEDLGQIIDNAFILLERNNIFAAAAAALIGIYAAYPFTPRTTIWNSRKMRK